MYQSCKTKAKKCPKMCAARENLILLPFSLLSPFSITRFYVFVYKYLVNESFAFSPAKSLY